MKEMWSHPSISWMTSSVPHMDLNLLSDDKRPYLTGSEFKLEYTFI
jgi:hypothetical protein